MANDLQARQARLLQDIQEEEQEYKAYLQRMKPEKLQRITNALNSFKTGLHAVAPVTCQGPIRCPFVSHCPIPTVEQKSLESYGPESDYPMQMPCVLETMFQRQKIVDYVQHLDVDPDNPVEMALVNELALIDLYKNRALMIMSSGDRDGDGRDFLRQDDDWKEVGDGAELVKRTSLHPAFEVIDRLERRRERLLERLMQTRKSQAEYDLKRGAIKEDSNVLRELQEVKRFLLQASAGTGAQDDQQAIMVDD